MSRYRRRGYSGYRPSRGNAQALKHIEEARQFTQEIGGLDQDVKAYFFSLPSPVLQRVLDAYEREHGGSARAYAEQAIPKWQAGRVSMSGMVAQRLFGLLPQYMPVEKKYELTESMWRHFGPSSKKLLRVGPDASVEEIQQLVRDHIGSTVQNFRIPDNLERRFSWIAAGDVQFKQQLLNHFREKEKQIVIDGSLEQMSLLLSKLRADSERQIGRMVHVFQIGRHELHVSFESSQTGARLEDYRAIPLASSAVSSSGIGPWVVGGLVLLLMLLLFGR